jgi:hypothetical protein
MLAARVEPKNGPKENKKIGNFKPLVLSEFQAAVDTPKGDATMRLSIYCACNAAAKAQV